MSKPRRTYGAVECALWDDPTFRKLTKPEPNAQSLWLYLLTTGRRTAVPGLIVGRPAVIADDLQWDTKGLREPFGELFREGLLKGDPDAGVTILIKALRHSDGSVRETSRPPNPNVLQSWGKRWMDIPECPLKDWYLLQIQEFAKGLGKGFLEGFTKGFPEPFPEAVEPIGNPFPESVAVAVAEAEAEAVHQGVVSDSGESSDPPTGVTPEPDDTTKAEPTPPSKAKPPKVATPEAMELARRLRAMVLGQNPSAKCSTGFGPASLNKWGLTLDKLLQRYEFKQIKYAIKWLGGEQFGDGAEARYVVESAGALAKKMDSIAANIRHQQKAGTGPERTQGLRAMAAELRKQGR